jgi:M6 family metalloprotease-like protein
MEQKMDCINFIINRVFLYSFLILIFFKISFSAYLEYVPTKVIQPDGTAIECFITGDEFYGWQHDKDGYTIIKNPDTGWWVYAIRKGDLLEPTDLIFGKSNPETAGLNKWAKISTELIKQKRDEHYNTIKKYHKTKKEKTQSSGTINNLVVYIRFNDQSEYTDNISTYNNMFNATGNSMKEYFKEVSYNALTINSTFYPTPSGGIVRSYQDSHDRDYFRPYDADDNPDGYQNSTQKRNREHTLLADAIKSVRSDIPGSLDLDYDNDGAVDNVCFIIQGGTDSWSDLLWPHRWALYADTAWIGSTIVWDYNFQLQNFLTSYGNGVLSHEMFHTLGAPDLYHYNQDDLRPVGHWDIMASTTTPPQHMGAWMKYQYGGWISSIPQITTPGTYSLNPVTSSSNNCYRISSPNSSSQFFLLEYRNKTSGYFESNLPGSGLLVYRIIPDSVPNGNRNGPPDEVYIYRPGGSPTVRGTPDNAFFNSTVGRTSINDDTDPDCFLADGSDGGLRIYNIGVAGSTISFSVGMGLEAPVLIYPGNNEGNIPLNAMLIWSDVQDANSYNVQVSTNIGFSNIVYSQNPTDTTITISPNLEYGATYYWRVNSQATGTSEWSTIRIFTTKLEKPELTNPSDNEYDVLLTDTLHWQSVSGASYYTVEISEQSDFSSTIIQQSNIGNTYYIIPSGHLQFNSTYYWRIKAVNTSPSTESDWSDIRSFTTLLQTPVLTIPKNDSAGVALSGSFNWNPVNGATAYKLKFSANSGFSPTIIDEDEIANATYNFSNLDFNTRYFWKVQAYNASQNSLWSEIFNFITILEPPELALPSNGEGNVKLNKRFFWHTVNGADNYTLQLATDTNMTNIIFDESSIPDTNYVLSGLNSMTKYFWRVNAASNDGRLSNWSDIWSFNTILGSPKLPSPLDSAEDVPVEDVLSWDDVNGAVKYHVQLSDEESFNSNSLIIDDSTLTGTSIVYSDLESGITYYWHVRAIAGDSKGDWSNTWCFTTGLGLVKLLSPPDGEQGVTFNGILRWQTMTGAQSYSAQIAADINFNQIIFDTSGVTSTQTVYSGLQSNKLYFWRVNAENQSGTSEWSEIWDFVTSAGEPYLLSPPDNSGGNPLSGTLNWMSSPGATSYRLQFSENEDMSNPIADVPNYTDTFYVYSDLQHYKNYYWRVNSSNNAGAGPWSKIRKFTTIIAIPTLYSPENNIKNAPTEGLLEWDPVKGAQGYTLWISKQFDFIDKEIEEEGITAYEYQYSGLENNTKYYWKVMAENSDANSHWSEYRQFLTVLAKTSLSQPMDSAIQIQLDPKLVWNVVDGSKQYSLQISKNFDFNNLILDTTGIPFSFYDLDSLDEKTRYFWRVRASNNYSSGDWSDTWSFVTYDPVSVDFNKIDDFFVKSYPNPFNNKVIFEINASTEKQISISIFNQLGKRIQKIINGKTLKPGRSFFTWQPGQIEQGIYIVVINSNEIIKTFTISFIK